MRFTESGPSIPVELLTARDRGEVVFFCGAGVSIPAGLLSFFKLTVKVMEKLGVQPDSKVGIQMARAIAENDPELAPPFDQIFGQLQRTYTTEKIEKAVTRILKTPRSAKILNHDIVLRLSKDANGNPFVVTTNFDRMFERAMPGIKHWSPPVFPTMTNDAPHSGVVYLHGRLGTGREPEGQSNSLVLGSPDFGRAYLADGWATSFFRQLLERKTVVLLGYSAGDPPIRYLLEGLNASTSAKLQPIYAFDRGEETEVSSKWDDLGVTGIAFDQFADLWATLAAWAERADDPAAWRLKTLQLATTSPRALKPFERGQVAALAATSEGAKAFTEPGPAPCAEWLCVFDTNMRYSKQDFLGRDEGGNPIESFSAYGLDDDPLPEEGKDGRVGGIDILGRLSTDIDDNIPTRLAGNLIGRRGVGPRRLWFLSRWFHFVADQPMAIWWASKQIDLNQDLIWGVNQRLAGTEARFTGEAQRLWRLLLEIGEDKGGDNFDLAWYDFASKLRHAGWDNTAHRSFEKAVRPRLKVSSWSSAPISINNLDDMDIARSGGIVGFEVYCPSTREQRIEIPDEVLPKVVSSICRALERTVTLLEDAGRARFFHLPTIDPEEGGGERHVTEHSPQALFLWAVQLFRQLAQINVTAARKEMARWPENEGLFFDKFRLFAWRLEGLVSASDVGVGILSLSEDSFWNAYLDRDVLHVLRARWGEFGQEHRRAIELRIANPGEAVIPDDANTADRVRTHFIGSRLGWLSRNACDLSLETSTLLENIRGAEDWAESYETRADRDMDGRSGWVQRETDPSDVSDATASNLITRCEEVAASANRFQRFVEKAPFEGVVATRPAFALSALMCEARRKSYPVEYWRQLLGKWPEGASARVHKLLVRRLANIPPHVSLDLTGYLGSWIESNAGKAFENDREGFFALWDGYFDALQANGADATASAIGEISTGGRALRQGRKTLDHAFNGPVGQLVRALFGSLKDRSFKKGEKFSKELTSRLERGLMSIGEGADHTACILGYRLAWLYHVDRKWTERVVLPSFTVTHPLSEAAWNGLLFNNQPPRPAELFQALKPQFVALFEDRDGWEGTKGENNAIRMAVIAAFWNAKRHPYISMDECRRVLQAIDDAGRQTALSTLQQIIEGPSSWKGFGRQFFETIWPQEAKFQSGSVSDTMLRIAVSIPERFPDVFSTVKDYLRPIDHPDIFVFRLRRTDENGETETLSKRWPLLVLDAIDRAIAVKPVTVPIELAAILEDIAEADPTARSLASWRRLAGLTS